MTRMVAGLGGPAAGPTPAGPLDRPDTPAVGADVEKNAMLNKATMQVDKILQYGKANQFSDARAAYDELMRIATSQEALPETKLELSRGAFNLFVLLQQAGKAADADKVFGDLRRLAASPGALPEMRLRFAKAAVNQVADYGDEGDIERAGALYRTLEEMAARIGGTPESKPDMLILDAWWRALEVYSPLLAAEDDAKLDALLAGIEADAALSAAASYLAALAEEQAGGDSAG
ncbi:MAG: hypothetical protein R3F55_21650 [Alphaproteobacteria bacterium]